jgi:lipopolysaccharide/colanic/teichoic acid biosynthesis glycosyltransferase
MAAKRAQDLTLSIGGVIALAPLMGAIAIAIKLDSPGPIFFRQRRHGYMNEEIVVWKFRSMRVETTDHKAIRQVSADDDRVTRVGRLIRKTSLDELPQIFNIITGEMSIVGPRPHAIGMLSGGAEASKLVETYAHRHRIKPGLTGWAAVNGSRGPVDTAEDVRRRVALDLEYVERQSFWLDASIILKTVPCLLGDSETVR